MKYFKADSPALGGRKWLLPPYICNTELSAPYGIEGHVCNGSVLQSLRDTKYVCMFGSTHSPIHGKGRIFIKLFQEAGQILAILIVLDHKKLQIQEIGLPTPTPMSWGYSAVMTVLQRVHATRSTSAHINLHVSKSLPRLHRRRPSTATCINGCWEAYKG